MTTKKIYILIVALCCFCTSAFAQLDQATAAKRAQRHNLTVKEWNTDAKSKTRWLDRMTVYDAQGRKVEEIEYSQYGLNQYGQKWRLTCEYGENDRVVKEVMYDEKDKPTLIRKFEYDASGRKVKQYNYAPNGKLQTIKVFEYAQ